jgi:hypothetical protein
MHIAVQRGHFGPEATAQVEMSASGNAPRLCCIDRLSRQGKSDISPTRISVAIDPGCVKMRRQI